MKEEPLLKHKIYTGKFQSGYTLEIHSDGHRHSHHQMKSALEHVDFQLLNQSTMSRYLIDTIKCTVLLIMASIANIQCAQDPKEKCHNNELVVAFFLLAYPVAVCLARRDPIVDNTTAGIGLVVLKKGMGRARVKL